MNNGLEKCGKDIIYLVMIVTLTLFVSMASFSYAILTKDFVGEKTYSIQIGMFDLEMQEENNSIRLLNAYPMTDEEGRALNPYKFSITNTGDYEEDYRVLLIEAENEKSSCQGCTFLEPSKLRYALTVDGIEKSPFTVKSNTILESGSLEAGKTRNYELRLWLNHDATVEEENKFYYGKIKVEAVQSDPNVKDMVSRKLFVSNNLGENCTTYDDGVDTFLVGQCQNNYVWYSGKLWRVVLKNNATGAVKMITDNAITSIPYAEGNAAFEDSYMDQWLTQEFLPTLHDYEDYLVVDSIWDATLDNSYSPSRPAGTTTVRRTVGLLNTYEYYTTYNNSDGLATCETGYLKNATYWRLMTPYDASNVLLVNDSGTLNKDYLGAGYGARPSINLQSNIRVIQGRGTQSDPYRLESDSQETVGGTTLLSTRYSGEYITFNNELYRIVGIENNLTKIIAVDKPEALKGNVFHSVDEVTNFANADIKTDLETYYQNNVVEPYKTMIELNTTWYLGTVEDGTNYKASICKIVNAEISANTCERTDTSTTASIGLPRVGEMFTSQITRGRKAVFWTLTPCSTSIVRSVYNGNGLSNSIPTMGWGLRPSMYLKSNVVISSTNTGDGTYEHPYMVELGK